MSWTGVSRGFLVLVNVLYAVLLISLVTIAFLIDYMSMPELLNVFKGTTLTDLNSIIENTGLGSANFYGELEINKFLSSFLLVVFMGSLFVFVVAVTGCCGGCCKMPLILKLYATVLIIMLIVEVAVTVILYAFPDSMVVGSIKSSLTSSVVQKYQGLIGNNSQTFGWNFVMLKYDCCGVYSYEDFKASTSWKNTITAGGTTYTLKTPIVCCDTLVETTNLTCATVGTGVNANKGCFDKVWKASIKSVPLAVLGLGLGLLLQLLLIIASCYYSDKIKTTRVESIEVTDRIMKVKR